MRFEFDDGGRAAAGFKGTAYQVGMEEAALICERLARTEDGAATSATSPPAGFVARTQAAAFRHAAAVIREAKGRSDG